jgi:hypothetical protein
MPVTGCSYALLADGTTAEIRPAGPDDLDAVTRFHRDMSPDNLYLRFFGLSKRAAEQEARRVCRPADADHAALAGTDGDDLIRQIRAAPLQLDLNPVIARPDGVFAVDARVRVASHRAADPFLRQLRTPPGEQRPEEEGVPQ